MKTEAEFFKRGKPAEWYAETKAGQKWLEKNGIKIALLEKWEKNRLKIRRKRYKMRDTTDSLGNRFCIRRDHINRLAFKRKQWAKDEKLVLLWLPDGSRVRDCRYWNWNPQTNYQRRHGYGSGYYSQKFLVREYFSENSGVKILKKVACPSTASYNRAFRDIGISKILERLEKKLGLAWDGTAYSLPGEKNLGRYHCLRGDMGEVFMAFEKRRTANSSEKKWITEQMALDAGACAVGVRKFRLRMEKILKARLEGCAIGKNFAMLFASPQEQEIIGRI